MVDPWMSIEFLMIVRIIHGYPLNSWMFMDVFGKTSSISANSSKNSIRKSK
jgi:hypothetical protein